MYDPVSLDQLRALVTVVEEGSFSAAARKLQRVQSAVSAAMTNLESQLGVSVWDRSTKVARLTPQGQAVLGAARRVLAEVDGLRRLASGMGRGLEARVALCLDALFPLSAVLDVCEAFADRFPSVELRVDTQVMSAVSLAVTQGAATLGVASPHGLVAGLERQPIATIRMLPVVSPRHPLARHKGPVPTSELADATQIVLSERTLPGVPDQAVLSPRTWRVADLHTKHMMLERGLGWGNLPEHLVRDSLRRGRLVVLHPASWGDDENVLQLSAVYRSDTVLGPAHLWILDALRERCAKVAAPPRRGPRPRATKGPARR
jgi:DNA-binding transcriptional LysR family regulator